MRYLYAVQWVYLVGTYEVLVERKASRNQSSDPPEVSGNAPVFGNLALVALITLFRLTGWCIMPKPSYGSLQCRDPEDALVYEAQSSKALF
jgi:hypothetical protein